MFTVRSTGKVTAGNAALATQPELLNQDPYGAGWLFRVQTTRADRGRPRS